MTEAEKQTLLWDDTTTNTLEETGEIFRKHRSIIHRTHGNTVMEEKIFSGLLFAAKVAMRTGIDSKKGFVTTEKYLKTFSGLKTKNREHLRLTIDGLQTKLWKFDFFDQEDTFKELRTFSPISEARYAPNGEIKFFLPPTLIEVLSNPDVYAAIDSKITSKLQSVYSIAIYEMGQAYIDREMAFPDLVGFRKYMGLKNEEYTSFGDLRRHVIDKGCDEVNLKTDTRVEYLLLREGRKIIGVKFRFARSSEPLEIPSDIAQLEVVIDLSAMLPVELRGIPWVVSLLTSAVNKSGAEWARSNVEAFVERINSKVGAPVKSAGALLRTAFKDDYGKAIRDARTVLGKLKEREAEEVGSKEKERELSRKGKERKENAEQQAIKAEAERYAAYFQQMPEETQAEVLKEIGKIPTLFGPQSVKIHQYLKEYKQVILSE